MINKNQKTIILTFDVTKLNEFQDIFILIILFSSTSKFDREHMACQMIRFIVLEINV